MSSEPANSDFDEKKYANAQILSAQIPVIYYPGCNEIRDEHEMIDGKPECRHCQNS